MTKKHENAKRMNVDAARVFEEERPLMIIDPELLEDSEIQSLALHELLSQHSHLTLKLQQIQCRLTQISLNLQKRKIPMPALPQFVHFSETQP